MSSFQKDFLENRRIIIRKDNAKSGIKIRPPKRKEVKIMQLVIPIRRIDGTLPFCVVYQLSAANTGVQTAATDKPITYGME